MRISAACLIAFFILQDSRAVLPESNTFITEFRKTLRSDGELQQNYSFTETETRTERDRSGNPKKTEVRVYQVRPDRGQLYRRLISKDGVPLSPSQLAKEDRDQALKKPAAPRDDSGIRNEVFEIYDLEMQEREHVEGLPTIVLSFRPRPGYKPQTRLTNFLIHVSGRIWVNEIDHQLVRLDAEVVDPVSFGWFLGRLDQGTRLIAQRRKFDSDAWLPAMLEIEKSQRVLLKFTNLREVHEYSEYRKVKP